MEVRLFWHVAGREKYEASKNLLSEIKKKPNYSGLFSPAQFGFINNISEPN
jgi:hypothetical protein